MIQKFRNHPYLKHFAAYSINYLLYGLLFSGLGPLIPYLSEQSGIIQTEYSFLFSCRSFGMLTGAIILKLLQKNFSITIHNQIICSYLVIFLTSWLFCSSKSLFWQGSWMYVSTMAYAIFQIQLNVCILLSNPKKDMQFWMLLANGCFGMGGLIGPLMVYIFETNSLTVIGIILMFLLPTYILLPSPQLLKKRQDVEQQDSQNISTTQRITPRKIEILLCFITFIYIGADCTFGGWISSYSILAGVSTKQNAIIYPSIFWFFYTVFRFVSVFLPGTTSDKMKWQFQLIMCSGVLSLILIYSGYVHQVCYISAILFGTAFSSIYALILTVSTQYSFVLADYQTGNIVTAGVLGEGFLTMPVGALMEYVHINMLFYGMIVMAFVMEILRRLSIQYFQQAQYKVKEIQIQLKENLIKA